MANIVINKTAFLDAPITVDSLHGMTFTNESGAHQFVISAMQGGNPLALTGSVSARFMRANNTTILLTGSVTGGKAVITLHQDCYNVPGRFQLAIFNTASGTTTCIYAAIGTVQRTVAGELIDSGEAVPDISELLAQIDACEQATAAANAAATKSVRYDTTQTLTETQKTQARTNIDGASTDDVESVQSLITGGLGSITVASADITSGVWAANNQGECVRTSSTNYVSPNSPGVDISDFVVGGRLVVYASLVSNYGAFILDADGNVIGDKYVTANHLTVDGTTYTASGNPANVGPITFIIPQGAKYLAVDWRQAYYNDSYAVIRGTVNGLAGKVTSLEGRMSTAENDIDTLEEQVQNLDFVKKVKTVGLNLYNPEAATDGFLQEAGTIAASNQYITSDYIPVTAGQSVYINRHRSFLAFDTTKTPISGTYRNSWLDNLVYTATQNGYVRACFSNTASNMIAYSGTAVDYVPYEETTKVEENIHLPDTMKQDVLSSVISDVLAGKKWVACGDSFTAGSFSASLTNNYIFTDEPYYGKNKVYPYFIGRRNPTMTVINEAIPGSQMSAGGTNPGNNAFSQTRYTNIPADADYITLMFGINDAGHDVPIGTISDTTNTTFYGAWNVVLEYLIANHPFAHIGIIVGPGMQTTNGNEKADAEIAVAKKWGIPYLNIQYESGGGKIPLMLRTSNPDVAQTVKNACNNRQYVNPSSESPNYHPNESAHEFESTFIEAWLRTL